MRWSRLFLIAAIGTLTLAALMGLAAVLSVTVNWELIGTDLVISLFSLTCLGASYTRNRPPWHVATAGTYVASAVGLVLALVLIWDAVPSGLGEVAAKVAGIAVTWSIALPATALLAMTRFSNALRVVRVITLALVALLAGEVSLAIVVEADDDMFWRLIAATTILAALGTVSLPVLYRLYGRQNPSDVVSATLAMRIVCPRCSHPQTIPAGESACARCRLRFRVEIEEPRCPGCNYLLYQLTSPRCPECGRSVGTTV